MKAVRAFALDEQDAEFVADALKYLSTHDACTPEVQARARELARRFRRLVGKIPTKRKGAVKKPRA